MRNTGCLGNTSLTFERRQSTIQQPIFVQETRVVIPFFHSKIQGVSYQDEQGFFS